MFRELITDAYRKYRLQYSLLFLASFHLLLRRRRRKQQLLQEKACRSEGERCDLVEAPLSRVPSHNLARKAAIASGVAKDHGGAVRLGKMANFRLDGTIFASVDSVLTRAVLEARLGTTPFWREKEASAIEEAYASCPGAALAKLGAVPSSGRAALLDFMETECNFKCEHADGSFMDHLHFCHDYAAVHYKGHSPRVLFLHSILGVGTNIFPMEASKWPRLCTMLTDEERKHVEAFPSILRLLVDQKLLPRLREARELGQIPIPDDMSHSRALRVTGLRCFRVIDNTPLSLNAEDLWDQLNYQLIHLLDFLPESNWAVRGNDMLFLLFIELHDFLRSVGRLEAEVDYQLASPAERFAGEMDVGPVTLGALIARSMPDSAVRAMAARTIRRFSKQCGHSLEFSLETGNYG